MLLGERGGPSRARSRPLALAALGLAFTACAEAESATGEPTRDAPAAAGPVVLQGGFVVGAGALDVRLADGKVAEVGAAVSTAGATVVDVRGRWLVPAFVDSHVHLAYLPAAATLADGGIGAAVDLAAPEAWMATRPSVPRLLVSGPMITGVRGYPTQGWGYDGYGRECADAEAARAAVAALLAQGAGVIKVAAEDLDDAQLAAVVAAAHTAGIKVATHALDDQTAQRAGLAGVDVLAHVPVERLGADTVAAWADRAVVPTLAAFGAGSTAVDNVRSLRAAGTTVLYGTDFGNSREPGISGPELVALQAAGLDGAAILAAGTSAPAKFWGWPERAQLAPGAPGDVLVLAADPTLDPLTLAAPAQVWIGGARR